MKINIALLEMAKMDLEASKILFENKLYPLAVFHLQQSVEKAVKSLGIRDGIITESEAKKAVWHYPIEVYVKMTKHWKNLGLAIRNSGVVKVLPELETFAVVADLPNRISELEDIINLLTAVSKNYKSVLVSGSELDQFLSEIAEARDIIEKIRRSVDIEREWEMEKEKLHTLLDIISKVFDRKRSEMFKEKLDGLLKEKNQEMKNDLKSSINLNLNLAFCDIALFYLSLILLFHAVHSRYPENDSNPLEIYTADFPLIKRFGQITDIVAEVLSKMSCYISN